MPRRTQHSSAAAHASAPCSPVASFSWSTKVRPAICRRSTDVPCLGDFAASDLEGRATVPLDLARLPRAEPAPGCVSACRWGVFEQPMGCDYPRWDSCPLGGPPVETMGHTELGSVRDDRTCCIRAKLKHTFGYVAAFQALRPLWW